MYKIIMRGVLEIYKEEGRVFPYKEESVISTLE